MYVTYDLPQKTRGGNIAMYPKVKRVYIAGDGQDWEVGDFEKRTGRKVHGVGVEYEQSRKGTHRKSFTAHRNRTTYRVGEADVRPSEQTFEQIVEVPDRAENIQFHPGALPAEYQQSIQHTR